MLENFEHGHAKESDLELLASACNQIAGRSFCALGDAAATPFPAALKYFRDEFIAATNSPVDDEFDPVASYIYAGAATR